MLSARDRLFRFTYEKAARRWVSPSSSAGVSILRTSAPMSASIMPGISAGGTRASSRTLMPSRTPMPLSSWMTAPPRGRAQGGGWSAIPVGRLDRGGPEHRVMAREDASAREPRDGLESLDGVHGPGRIPDDAGGNLLVDRLLPVAAISGQDHRARLGQVDQQRLVPRRVAVAA